MKLVHVTDSFYYAEGDYYGLNSWQATVMQKEKLSPPGKTVYINKAIPTKILT